MRAWQKPNTIIVNEIWWNAQARHADIIFPATTLDTNRHVTNAMLSTNKMVSCFIKLSPDDACNSFRYYHRDYYVIIVFLSNCSVYIRALFETVSD